MSTLPTVELGVLGPLQVRQDGAPVAIPGAKPRAILTMLGLHGGSVVGADVLVELIWDDDPPRTAVKALQTHISSLRHTLGDGFVLTEGAGWRLSTTEIDASRYKLAAKLGRDAAAAGDISQAAALFEEALGLWRGIPELPDGQRGTAEKTRWIEGHAALVEDRADALLATGRAAEVIGDLEAAVSDAPLRERRWGQLMLALYRAGRQGEALGAYRRARSLLADELGVDPGPDLRRLEAAIVAQDAALEIPASQHIPAVTRAVTFLLTDIEGSTDAWEADADAMAVALARHDELVEQVVTSRGGRLIKTRGEGDATFSVFERPSGAAAAAIELQDAILHEPWALREAMRIRVALHTGEVEFRDGDYFGRAVNRAARLRSLAVGGQILCSGATAELVIDSLRDDVLLTDLGMRQLKNLARPEHVFELRLETADDGPQAPTSVAPMERPGMPTVLAGHGPFVGRGRELDRLLSAWQTALAGGMLAVLLAGEPGVGKTRLAGEWSRHAYEQGAIVLYGRCDEDLGAPYQPFAEALRPLMPCLGSGRLRGLRGVESLLPLVPGLTEVLPDLSAPSRADADTERYALFDAVVALLGIASTSAPVVLILDDLHWAAKPTLLLLRHLLRFGEHARVQIVGTYRSTDLDRSHPLAAMLADLHRDGTASRIQLAGLDETDVSAYLAEAGYDDEELAQALASVTGGNPFFLIEALRHVDESGGVWDPSTLPQGVREAVSRRLSRLPAETNKALAAAAVVGSRFALDLVEQVVDQDLVDAFDEACKAGIIIEEPGGRYRFNHAIVRQSLLAELASVRRMRLHQRIATTLENSQGADDELLAELAHHYFECAWAGNAAKAVDYCRRAADQAMARLAYEGAADLYDRALHAMDELDEDLPDRDDQRAELSIARCEALLAAGDMGSAAGAVAQLREATVDSPRLAAWATCFDGQLSMLTDPERLDEIESAVGAAADKLAGLDDAAGEAKAHTVRAGCLARLGRIADCEVALDHALTAARRAREHRRVNAVLAGAPLAALWGPNPVSRAGGRCLDVVRLLLITSDSPAVEATSTRCQAVLDAFRGRSAAARRIMDSTRRTVTELGLRHALLEVEHFAGIVELVADDAASAEPHLRLAYDGFRRLGLDADAAEAAALLGRACLALDRDDEADELCTESERLAGHALRASIAWRSVRAQLLARSGAHDEARRVAEEAVAVAERTDGLVDHGDACLALATVLSAAGDAAGARAAAERAAGLYERKGATALVAKTRNLLGNSGFPAAPAAPEAPTEEMDNACVRAIRRVEAAIDREAWGEVEQQLATDVSVEARRKIVGFPRTVMSSSEWTREARHLRETSAVRHRNVVLAVRGERLALTRSEQGTEDESPGAPQVEVLRLIGLDKEGRIALYVAFDVEDIDAAMAELDAAHARLEDRYPRTPLENAASRAEERFHTLYGDQRWDEIVAMLTDDIVVEERRQGIRRESNDRATEAAEIRVIADLGVKNMTSEVLAIRGDRIVLSRVQFWGRDRRSDAFHTELLRIVEIDADDRVSAVVTFDLDDVDAAFADLDARYLAGEAAPYADAWQIVVDANDALNRHEPLPTAWNVAYTDHRRIPFGPGDFGRALEELWKLVPDASYRATAVHALDTHGAVIDLVIEGTSANGGELQWTRILVVTRDSGQVRVELYEEEDLDAALARFDQLRPQARPLENAASQVYQRFWSHFVARDWVALAELLADDSSSDDRRRVVNAGVQHGRDALISNMRTLAEIEANITSTVMATRGERLVLSRVYSSNSDLRHGEFDAEMLSIIEIDTDYRIAAGVVFDLDNIDAAFVELDARYLAGEAAAHSHTWSLIAESFAAVNRHELPALTQDWVNLDHRRTVSFAPGEMTEYIHATLDDTPDFRVYVEAVHRLSDLGAAVTWVSSGTSQAGFQAEWREVNIATVEGDLINRSEMFDDKDVDAALARFDELSRPSQRLENAASKVDARFNACFAARDWDAIAEMLTDDFSNDDRRRTVNAGVRHGRDAETANLRTLVDLGVKNVTSVVIATRGGRLALTRTRLSGGDERTGAFDAEILQIVEIDANQRYVAVVLFDLDNMDAALKELDARYLAGEAAAHSHTWSVISEGYATANRGELAPTAPDLVNIDHRQLAMIESGELIPYLRNTFDELDISTYLEAVHRLTDLGAVVTHVGTGTSKEGFDAEWRLINVIVVDGDLFSRTEVFDETDIDAALAKFEELSRPARQLENAASRVGEHFVKRFAARDWDAMAEMLADGFSEDDRRRIVNAGIRHGRDAEIESSRAAVDLGITTATSAVVATRGERVALLRTHYSDRDQARQNDVLQIVEIDAEERIEANVVFDLDNIDAAFADLDARYLAGEAATYSNTWSVVTQTYAALNRRERPATTPDWMNSDHRRAIAFEPGELISWIRASWDIAPDINIHIEAAHRLTNSGAVVTHTANATSQEGFDAEWRVVALFTVEGELINRVELYDEEDLDAALARFDELSRPAPLLVNAASQVYERCKAYFAARDWVALEETLAPDIFTDDRRPVLGAGVRHGRDAELANWRAVADIGAKTVTSTVIATRGDRLALSRVRFSGRDDGPEAFHTELLGILEINADNRIAARITVDVDDLDAAFEELEARYLAGEAAAYARTWSVIAEAYAAIDRHDLPPTTPDWVNIDHRRGTAFAPGDMTAFINTAWDVAPDITIYIEAVHRLGDLGAVVTHAVHGTSHEGFDAEWRVIALLTVDGDLINRCELFDEADIDAAFARFEELHPQIPRRLENAATRVYERLHAKFTARDWDGIAEILADDYYQHDRRPVVGGEIRHGRRSLMEDLRAAAGLGVTEATSDAIATRGERLTLTRVRYSRSHDEPEAYRADLLQIVEIDADERITALVAFDLDNIDAAFAELDARYVAGEAAAHAHTWSVIAGAVAAVNRHELPAFTPDFVDFDHRRAVAFAPGDMTAYIRASLDDAPDFSVYIESVHLLTDLGAVVTQVAQVVSQQGFDAEWRMINLMTVEGDQFNRSEVFDEADIDAALARFDELHSQTPQLKNAASQLTERFVACFAARDWTGMATILAVDSSTDDRRRVVGAGVIRGRDNDIASMRASAEVGVTNIAPTVIATRGERLALGRARFSGRDQGPDAFHIELLGIVEINADNQIAARIFFDLDDIDAAFAELDARYVAGEAAAYAHTWSVITRAYAALNRRELPAMTPDWANIDHRRGTSFAPGDFTAFVRSAWDVAPEISIYIETVHALSDRGAVVTQVTTGTSHEGFDAEWREIALGTIDGDLPNRGELFDEADIDAALARFYELSRPDIRLENAASQVDERFGACFAAGDWDAMAEMLADDTCTDDRRRIVNSGIRHGRDPVIASMRAIADVGVTNGTSATIATRGGRLALSHIRMSGRDQGPEGFHIEMLGIVEINADERIVARVTFDADDLEAAFDELDARYLAGEAAGHADVWSVVARAYAALNRHELFATTPDWVNVDHRRATSFAPGDLAAFVRTAWDVAPEISIYIEAVHALSDRGVVVTQVTNGTAQEGFDAEWREIAIGTVEDDLINRCELFDEADIDAALARFDELSLPARRLENAASQVFERFRTFFAARDWTAMAEILADDMCNDDRRRLVGAGVLHGRDTDIAHMRAIADVGAETIASTVIATRGERLILSRIRFSGEDQGPEAFHTDILGIVEIDADERIVARLSFDPDDIDAAFEELDARYLAGEAAKHARTWSVVAQVFDYINRQQIPPTTPDFVNFDHRKLITFAPGDLVEFVRSAFNQVPDINFRIEAVHRLSDVGGVVTHAAHGTSQEGFDAEWRGITVLTVKGDLINRCEIFDEADIDAAIAKFDELSRPGPQLENAASQVAERFVACFAARDWTAMAELLAEDMCNDDRRRLVGAGVLHGRDADIANMRAVADVGTTNITSTVIATRGERLFLGRVRFSGRDQTPEAFHTDMLGIVEINADERIIARVGFDPDDIDAAVEELDARYLAGEAAEHSDSWSVIAQAFAAINRREFPATTPDWVNIDHRRAISFAPGDMTANIRAAWDQTPEFSVYIEAVHRLSNRGAVITRAVNGTSREGFDAEWRVIEILTVRGDLINGLEIFDEADIDAALEKFDELSPPAPRLENAASRLDERFRACFAAHDWDAIAEILAADTSLDDRRRVVNVGLRRGRDIEIANARAIADIGVTNIASTVIATRGERLALARHRFMGRDQRPEAFHTEALVIVEIDAANRIAARVGFDIDDVAAAFAELDARYVAGEAAAHSHTWSVITRGLAGINRHELPATTPDWINIDHRRVTSFAPGDLFAFLRASWDQIPDVKFHIETVHRLSDHGVVVTQAVRGTSQAGFEAEWRYINVLTVEGDLINGSELFDEADIDAALARLDELSRPARHLENAASHVYERCNAYFAARDWDALAAIMADDIAADDRRRVVGSGVQRGGRETVIANTRAIADLGMANVTSTVIATRGGHLILTRASYTGRDQGPGAFRTDLLDVVETDAENRLVASVIFDPDDIDAAFEELDARYLAGEAGAHAHTWSLVAGVYTALNRREFPATTPDFVNVDHRRVTAFAPGDAAPYIRALWDVAPDVKFYIEAVHRLSDLGAVVTHTVHGTTQEGFEAEWREIVTMTVEGDQFNRSELFDEADIDTALARFDELSTQAPVLANAATRARTGLVDAFNRRDLDGFVALLTPDGRYDDRRKGLRDEGLMRRNIAQAVFEAPKSWRQELESVAIRGARLGLTRDKYRDTKEADRPITGELLTLTEVDDEGLVRATILFDPDDINAAIAELTARWISSGEVAHPELIESVLRLTEAANRHDWDAFATLSAGAAYINHRQLSSPGVQTIADHMPSIRMMASLVPDYWVEFAAVLADSAMGLVSHLVLRGTSTDGVAIEIPLVVLTLVEGDRVTRFEAFDADQRDLALARFEELSRPV